MLSAASDIWQRNIINMLKSNPCFNSYISLSAYLVSLQAVCWGPAHMLFSRTM
jgi:hypothetical protein